MSDVASLIPSAKIQGRIIGALLRREILTRYGRHNIGFMWLFVEPMMFTSGVLILWASLGLHKVRLPMVAFALSGYGTVLLWRNTINRCGDALEPNRALLHHRNVRVIDLFAARVVLEIAGASMSLFILEAALTATGLVTAPDDVFKMIIAWVLLAWFAADMALIIGSISTLSESAERVWHVLSYLFLPLSGAFFMVGWLPKYAQSLVLWIPTVSCTELLREGLFGVGVIAHYRIGYLLVVNTALMLPGLLLIKYIAARVEGE
ncbi:MAG TPA: ABC transporter permease [Steroidobacteraceae bacterium]|nr:ABC transporter permease [Steroidobacteraceae bacterium]